MELSSSEVDTLASLRLISMLKHEHKLRTSRKQIGIDKRNGLMQSVSRFFNSENRNANLDRVKTVISDAFEMMRRQRRTETCLHVAEQIEQALNGLRSMQVTYHTDLRFCSLIDVLCSTIQSRVALLRKNNFQLDRWVPFDW